MKEEVVKSRRTLRRKSRKRRRVMNKNHEGEEDEAKTGLIAKMWRTIIC